MDNLMELHFQQMQLMLNWLLLPGETVGVWVFWVSQYLLLDLLYRDLGVQVHQVVEELVGVLGVDLEGQVHQVVVAL